MAFSRSKRAVLVLALSVGGFHCLTLSPASALAAPSAVDRAKARALMDEGDRRVEHSDHSGALVVYREAHGIMGVPTTGIEVARTLASLGKLLEAREVALAVTRIPVQPREARVFGAARKAAADLARDLEQRIPSLTLEVRGPKQSSELSAAIDGFALEPQTMSVPSKLDPGSHAISISAPGYVSQNRTLTLAEGEHRTLSIELRAVEQPKPARAYSIPPTVTADHDSSDGVSPVVLVGFGVGAAGLVVGGVAGAMSLSRANQAQELCTNNQCPREASEDLEASRTWANISNVGFVVGAVGVGVGIVGLVSSGGSDERPQRAGVEPIVGPRLTGIRGRF